MEPSGCRATFEHDQPTSPGVAGGGPTPTTTQALPGGARCHGRTPRRRPGGHRRDGQGEDLRTSAHDAGEVQGLDHAVAAAFRRARCRRSGPRLRPGHHEQVGHPVVERSGGEEATGAAIVGMASGHRQLGADTGASVAGSRAAARRPETTRPRGAGRARPPGSAGLSPMKGTIATGAAEAGRDDGLPLEQAAGRRARADDGEPLHGPLPMRFTSATWLGLVGVEFEDVDPVVEEAAHVDPLCRPPPATQGDGCVARTRRPGRWPGPGRSARRRARTGSAPAAGSPVTGSRPMYRTTVVGLGVVDGERALDVAGDRRRGRACRPGRAGAGSGRRRGRSGHAQERHARLAEATSARGRRWRARHPACRRIPVCRARVRS